MKVALLLLVRRHPIAALLGLGLLGPVGVLAYFWAYSRPGWGTSDERAASLPGDDLLLPEDRFLRLHEEITIDARPDEVWPYLAQLGARKGGFYALAWLERLFSFHIFNTYELVDAWQSVVPGDFLFYHQSGIGSQIADVEAGQYFTSLSDTRRPPTSQGAIALLPPFGLRHFAWTWNFILLELPDGRTRFVNRCDATWEPFGGYHSALVVGVLGSPSVFMVRKMMQRVKKVAERRQRPSLVDKAVRSFGVSAQPRLAPVADARSH